MSQPSTVLKWRMWLLSLTLGSMTLVPSCQTAGTSSNWFKPTREPQGHETAWWDAGMANLKLRRRSSTQVQSDGSCVHVFQCSSAMTTIYVWDRISNDYNGPAIASVSPDFETYATLDHRNRAFTGSIYRQLRGIWSEDTTPSEINLLHKLREEVDESRAD